MKVAHVEFNYSAEFAANVSFRIQGAALPPKTGGNPPIVSMLVLSVTLKS